MVSLSLLAALALTGCPHDESLGSVTFVRGGKLHEVSLADCVDRAGGQAPKPKRPAFVSPDGRKAAVVRRTGKRWRLRDTIWVTDVRTRKAHPIYSAREWGNTVDLASPGPIELLGWSGDDRWVFSAIDPGSSASIAADGLILRVVSVAGGRVHRVGVMLAYPDYLTWCRGRLVFTGGNDRIATHNKRLLVASPPDWKPHPLWKDATRAFGSVVCAPDGRSVAVLSQPASNDAGFFAKRWQLWRVGLDGTRKALDSPPAGFADESPRWSRDGRALLFVRERNGNGRLMLWRAGRVTGPIVSLGYSIGYYGHHDWWEGAAWHA